MSVSGKTIATPLSFHGATTILARKMLLVILGAAPAPKAGPVKRSPSILGRAELIHCPAGTTEGERGASTGRTGWE